MDWYAAIDGNQQGPMTEARLWERFGAGEITAESFVWRDGMPNWQPLASVFPERFPDRPTGVSTPGEATATCAVSGKVMPESQMLRYGDVLVAPEYKESFVQGLREGSAPLPLSRTSGLAGYAYQTPASRAIWAKIGMLMVTLSNTSMVLIEKMVPESNPEEFAIVDLILGLNGLAILVFLVLAVVFFSMWTHRVVANAHAFGGKYNDISPGWAVGWYFIPFANLVKPYQALKQAWQTTFDDEAVPSILPAWWGFWIVSGIIGNISFRLTMNEMTEAAMIVDFITLAINIPLLFFIWKVVTRLSDGQVRRGEGIRNGLG